MSMNHADRQTFRTNPSRPLTGDAQEILLIEDSHGEAELFQEALRSAWATLVGEEKTPPLLAIEQTAKGGLTPLQNMARRNGRLPRLVVATWTFPGTTESSSCASCTMIPCFAGSQWLR